MADWALRVRRRGTCCGSRVSARSRWNDNAGARRRTSFHASWSTLPRRGRDDDSCHARSMAARRRMALRIGSTYRCAELSVAIYRAGYITTGGGGYLAARSRSGVTGINFSRRASRRRSNSVPFVASSGSRERKQNREPIAFKELELLDLFRARA